MASRQKIESIRILGCYSDLSTMVDEMKVDRIVVALDDRRGRLPAEDLVSCKFKGVIIDDMQTVLEELTGKIITHGLYPSWVIFSGGFNMSRLMLLSKRFMDIMLACILLVLSLPVCLFTAMAIKMESEGPAFFSQKRVGEKQKLFTIYKFRSMRADAEKLTGPVWALTDDDRVTRVGKIIRRLRIDEIPQFFNILKGDMSFVGPRPERPHFVKKLGELIPFYVERFAVKPGLTGWAQVNYPYGASVEDAIEKLEYDLYYIKHISLMLDVLVVLKTAKVVMLRIGSR